MSKRKSSEVLNDSRKRKHIGFDDDTEVDDDEFDLTQSQVQETLATEAEVGIVEKVSVTNFMCHRRLEVSLGSNVNFIIGRNGSGKSAILTALIVGLGGNASNTSRGNSLKGFVKEGCSSATISITLRNRGTDAFKSDEYGKAITVERKLSADGAGSYKLKSIDGKVISTKKDELIEILDQYNIQIDNPVSILTQDIARSFLNASNEREKYAFFLKATQLEQLSSDYQLTIEEKDRTEETLNKKKKILPELYESVKFHEEKFKDLEQLQKMEVHVGELKKDLAWSMVAEKKVEVDKAQNIISNCEEKVPKYLSLIEKTLEDEKGYTEGYTEKAKEINSFNDEVQVLIEEKTELHCNYKMIKKSAVKSNEQLRRTERDMHSIQKDKNCLVAKIDEIKNTALRDIEMERQVRETKLAESKTMFEQFERQLSTSNNHLHQLDQNMKKIREDKFRIQNEGRDIQRKVENVRKRISSLEDNQKDKLSKFGRSTDSIVKAIEAAHSQNKFHMKPVGPLGAYISVKDERWCKAVEQCIKGTMCAYACHDQHDMLILKEIFKKHKDGIPQIIVSRFSDGLYDTSQSRPTGCSGLVVVQDHLQIDDHIAANTLIDQCSIESVLLIEDPKEAQKIMWNICPRGTNKAISLEGHEIIGGRSSKYYPCRNPEIRYLQRDVTGAIKRAEEELANVMTQQRGLKEKINEIEVALRRDKLEYDQTRNKCSKEQDSINHVMMEIKELETFEEEKLPDVDALLSEVEECDHRISQLSNELSEFTNEHSEKKLKVEEAANSMKDCDLRCQSASEKLEQLKEELNTLEHNVNKLKGHKVYYKDKLNELKNICETARKNHETILAVYNDTYEKACKYCDERATKRLSKSIESEIIKAQKRIENEELKRGNVSEITEKYHAALQRYDKAKKEIENCKKFKKGIDKAIKIRAKRFQDFQKLIVVRAVTFFQMLLSQRGYTGKLKFDHENETLTVQVNVEKVQGASTKDSKALSGGERSFSTICFIMALWEAMEAPFRCLDEFDVFMDMLNRRISMNMLMKIAKEQQTRQFILLTPQDMSNVHGSDRVRIFRLTDPERGQTTLPFQPVE